MGAVEMKFGRAPHGLEILRQAAGFENRTGPDGFVKAPYAWFHIISDLMHRMTKIVLCEVCLKDSACMKI